MKFNAVINEDYLKQPLRCDECGRIESKNESFGMIAYKGSRIVVCPCCEKKLVRLILSEFIAKNRNI